MLLLHEIAILAGPMGWRPLLAQAARVGALLAAVSTMPDRGVTASRSPPQLVSGLPGVSQSPDIFL